MQCVASKRHWLWSIGPPISTFPYAWPTLILDIFYKSQLIVIHSCISFPCCHEENASRTSGSQDWGAPGRFWVGYCSGLPEGTSQYLSFQEVLGHSSYLHQTCVLLRDSRESKEGVFHVNMTTQPLTCRNSIKNWGELYKFPLKILLQVAHSKFVKSSWSSWSPPHPSSFLFCLLSPPSTLAAQGWALWYSLHLGQRSAASPDRLLPVPAIWAALGDRPVDLVTSGTGCYV